MVEVGFEAAGVVVTIACCVVVGLDATGAKMTDVRVIKGDVA